MTDQIRNINFENAEFPARLRQLPDPPRQLYVLGGDLRKLLAQPSIAVVGSRKVTPYGRMATERLCTALAREGVTTISGLAIGVDGLAHQATLDANGPTIAVLPCGLDRIYPAGHRRLAEQIIASGGALVSEYEPGSAVYKLNFIARNRIVAGLADALLVTEAALKSGTLHTARFALEQGKDVLAVPGNITSETAAGTNNLIKSGAALVSEVSDILHALGVEPSRPQDKQARKGGTPEEQLILNFLASGLCDGAELLAATGLDASGFNQHLTMLEISGAIRALGGNRWALL